jgi:hypothetical protein
MTIINRRLCERLRLIKERASSKERSIRTEYTYAQKDKIGAPLHRCFDGLHELQALHRDYELAHTVAAKAAEDARKAQDAEEDVKRENRMRDLVDIMPTCHELMPFAKDLSHCNDT